MPPHPARIAAVSSLILIIELALIRLIPAEVRAVAYFTNLVLMATFFGLGTGCILQRARSIEWLLPIGLVLIFAFVWVGRGIVIHDAARDVHYWLMYSNVEGQAPRLPLFPAAALCFFFTATPFLALGQALAREMDRHPRLVAYGWDIGGSLAGTLLFYVSSLLQMPPWLWPALAMGVWGLVFGRSRLPRIALYVAAGALFLIFARSPYPSQWSPYYYVQHHQEASGLRVWVNSTFLQFAVDFDAGDPEGKAIAQLMHAKWSRPYAIYREFHDGESPKKVLILGAGTGNDVNIALDNGATEIVAVEIDPVVLELGRYNTRRPYDDPRVTSIVDDARHYLRTSHEDFDLVVFATVDSVTLLGTQANLRLENYVHTREALDDARRLLGERGMVAMYYSVFQPWLWSRIYATVRASFGEHVGISFYKKKFLFDTLLVGSVGIDEHRPAPLAQIAGGIPSTDDWPFMYLRRPTLAPVYLQLMTVILVAIAGVFLLLRRIHPTRGLHVNFLFLGLGFTLLESSAIVRLALVFGSTWTVNVLVFSSVLLMVFLANAAVIRGSAPPMRAAWIGLLAFVLLNWAFPLTWFFEVGGPLRIVLAGLLIGVPVFFAAVCFSRLFAKQAVTGYALGINLIGAMAGGVIEYTSMLLGMQAIWLVLLGIYALAWLSSEWFSSATSATQA